MLVYIDESGNLGKKDRYFVIAALVPQKPNRIKNIIKRCYVAFGLQKQQIAEIKGSRLDFKQKQQILNLLGSKDDFTISYIVVDKNHLIPTILKDKNVCYNYLLNFLFKPIIKGANEDVHIILDNHTIKVGSVNSLKDYIKIKAYTEWGFQKEITFEHMNSENSKNIQAIDIVCNIIWQKYNYGVDHLYNLMAKHRLHQIKFPFSKFGT